MKKFLIFLVAIIVTVCVGLTTYYFLRNDERITLGTKEIYCNVNDVISLEELEIDVFKKNKKTKYNYNAGGEEVTSMISFDETGKYYKAKKGGTTTVVISTTNKKYKKLEFIVHIGDGQENSPYYLSSEADLNKIGNIYSADAHYTLRNNINLSKNFQPIGIKSDGVSFEAFSGTFNGNGYTISGITLENRTNISNAGLFYELDNATVKDLSIKNTTIVGDYDYVGALAGKASGEISRINVDNLNITNSKTNSIVGGLVGKFDGQTSTISMCGVKNANIKADNTVVIDAKVGGLVGLVDQANISSTYAVTNIEIGANVNAVVGGLVGEFTIGQTNGNIQQSYAVVNTTYANNGAFVGKVSVVAGFDSNKANARRFFIGNYVATNSKPEIATDDSQIFNTLSDKTKHLYLIEAFADKATLEANTTYIYYAVGNNDIDKVYWDNAIWVLNANELPQLRFIETTDVMASTEYLTRDIDSQSIASVQEFIDAFSKDNDSAKYTLSVDIDLTGINWTPYAFTNSVLDGQGHTIKGLDLSNASGDYLGLFSYIDNSTIKNIVFEDAKISANATNAGVIAGEIRSTDPIATSTVELITIKNLTVSSKITNFGSITGNMVKGVVKNSKVENLTIADTAEIVNAAGFVAVAESGKFEFNTITASTIIGQAKVAGIVADNKATIDGVRGDVLIKHNTDTIASSIGGVVAENTADINNVELNLEIVIDKVVSTNYIGGVAGKNSGTISNVELTGKGISFSAKTGLTNYVGGIAGSHSGKIENAVCNLENVGSLFENDKMYVGGIAGELKGSVTKSIVGSNLNGNYVGGIASIMNNNSAVVDQVLVGKYETGKITDITIKGDNYVANLVYDLIAGTIKDIQCSSVLEGANNSTRTSLVTIMLQDKAVVRNVTINSELKGHGTFYLETFSDWGNYNGVTNKTRPNNIYEEKGHNTGIMESVVVNTEKAKANGLTYIEAEIIADIFGSTYNDSGNRNFVKSVNSSTFATASAFKGNHTVKATATFMFIPVEKSWTRNLTFDFSNQVWIENLGAQLAFLVNI